MTVLAFVCVVMAGVLLLFIAPAFVETTIPNNLYMVKITGPGSLTANGTAMIMLPIPADAEGVPAISEERFSENQPSWWQTSVHETPYGRMLAFTTTNNNLSDISRHFDEFETEGEPRMFTPVLKTPGNVSPAGFSESEGTYETVIFLDGIVPEETGISFRLKYVNGGGVKHLVRGDTWTTTVHANLSGTESGYIPVTANYQITRGGLIL